MKRLLIIGACCLLSCCFADEPQPIAPQSQAQPAATMREIGLRIDPLSKEQTDAGLTVDMIQDLISNELGLGSIYINQSITYPTLSLRMRTAQVGIDSATFLQLTYDEEAMLVRTRSMYHATTWSQSSVLTCDPINLKNEILATISILIKQFVQDYNKAMAPRAA